MKVYVETYESEDMYILKYTCPCCGANIYDDDENIMYVNCWNCNFEIGDKDRIIFLPKRTYIRSPSKENNHDKE